MAYSDENAERIETVRKCVGLIYSTLCPLFWVLWWCFFVYIDPSKCSELEYASTNNITGEVNRGGWKEVECSKSTRITKGCFFGMLCAMATWLVFYALSTFVLVFYMWWIQDTDSEIELPSIVLEDGRVLEVPAPSLFDRMGFFCVVLCGALTEGIIPVYPPCICMPIIMMCCCIADNCKLKSRGGGGSGSGRGGGSSVSGMGSSFAAPCGGGGGCGGGGCGGG